MTYKTILVHLDPRTRGSEHIGLAFQLAGKFGAHLVGLYAPGPARIPSYALAEAGPALRQVVEQHRADAARNTEKQFRDAAAKHGDARAEWRAAEGDTAAALRLNARYADLVVAAQAEPSDEPETRLLPHEIVLAAGRPVLFVPYAGRFADCGRRVLVAWDGGREAARAVSDALPLLARAESVEVSVFDPERAGKHGEQPGADIALYLSRHGVKVTVHRQSGAGYDVGAQILSRAADAAADLIVMGGYGHARVRELVLGGVTRTILESMTVPVLMSH
ncbi:MAG TPA: universal stress protein [Burkholderiales bacterium]|jgi:nucleotide-binding universal stress UspA family protein|nr:universal stress protein [Burkholderiales bacterium]